jgi:3'(2'), 5'-bisphosphate nucleotidase
MNDLRDELEAARHAARAAGEAAMRFYGRPMEVSSGRSPVTDADRAANEVILDALARAFPADAVLSEESRDSPGRLAAARVWIVDPLDGTREFLARNGEFAVMIGLAVGGEAVLGAVYLPDGDLLYSAAQGAGTWLDRGGRPRRVERSGGGRALRLVASRSHAEPLTALMQEALEITDVLPCGSVGVKCARIIEDERDLYLHPVPFLKEWDTCAPEVLAREAGAWVSDCRGEPLRYNKPDPRQPHGILVSALDVAGHVVGVVAPLHEAARESAPG